MIALVSVALVALGYTFVGYPSLMGLLARMARRPRPPGAISAVRADGLLPRVSVLLPAFNAALFLGKKIESLLAQDYPPDRLEILIYCDGCSDDTEKVARAIAATPAAGGRITVIASEGRLGKPTGLNILSTHATGDLLLLNDVRQPFSPEAVRQLTEAFADPRVGCATGRLRLLGKAGSGVYWRYEEWLRSQESQFRGMVGMTGPIGMIRRTDFVQLPSDIILDDVWLPMQQVLRGKRVKLVPAAEAFDTAFEDDREFSRKVRTLAGNYQLFARLPRLLIPFVNPIWFETFSHKMMRLLAPWMLLALAAGSLDAAWRGGGLMKLLVLAQILFYAAAAVGPRGGRLASVARTFVVLNTATVVGLWRFASGRQRVTWTTGRESAGSSNVLEANVARNDGDEDDVKSSHKD